MISTHVTSTVMLGSPAYGATLTVTNSGRVIPNAANGSPGIICPANVAAANLTNDGRIGGAGSGASGAGGIGVDLLASGTIRNDGLITGGNGLLHGHTAYGHNGGAAVDLAQGGSVYNGGHIMGGAGGAGSLGGSGGIGVSLDAGAILSNTGAITGGAGGFGQRNGAGGATGGFGIYAAKTVNLDNSGAIAGGAGGASLHDGGSGRAGVSVYAGSITNSGHMTGGAGGNSEHGRGGQGGAGVEVTLASLTDTGTLTGGAGGMGVTGGNGGAAVSIFTGRFVASGTFIGGAGGMGSHSDGVQGAAIALHASGTIVVEPDAVFAGALVADPETAGVLELAGTTAGTLSAPVTGFNSIGIDAGSTWTIVEVENFTPASLGVGGDLLVSGTAQGLFYASIDGGGTLATSSAGTVQIRDQVSLAGGTLTDDPDGKIVIGKSLTGAAPGSITVEKSGAVYGYGTIAGAPLVDLGKITALPSQGGSLLALNAEASGSGTLVIGNGGTVTAMTACDIDHIAFAASGSGTLNLITPLQDHFVLAEFAAGDVVDLGTLIADTLHYAGGALTLEDGGKVVDTLRFAGSYTMTDFSLKSDGHGGTEILFGAATPHKDYTNPLNTLHDSGGSASLPWGGASDGPVGWFRELITHPI